MKAWRNVKGNNGKRPQHVPVIKGGSHWLLDGMLIHGGYIKPAVPDDIVTLPYSKGFLRRAIRKAASRFK